MEKVDTDIIASCIHYSVEMYLGVYGKVMDIKFDSEKFKEIFDTIKNCYSDKKL